MRIADSFAILRGEYRFLPDNIRDKIRPPKHLIAQHLQIMRLVVVNRDPQRTILRQQPPDDLQPVAHQRQPDRMLQPVVVMGEGAAGVVRRVDEHALHLARELLLQRLQRQQVVAEDQPVVEDVVVRHPVLRVVGLLRIFQQNARLQLRPVLLADPGEFEFLSSIHPSL